ncbi:MAG: hypothetical protein QW221_04580 [Candidatus Korarchaeum sp.]
MPHSEGNLLEGGILKGYIEIFQRGDATYIRYPRAGKEYQLDPEERVRAEGM